MVVGPVPVQLPCNALRLDRRAAQRDLETAVAQVSSVTQDARVAGSGRRWHGENLIVRSFVVHSHLGARAAGEETQVNAEFLRRREFRLELRITEACAKTVSVHTVEWHAE